MALDGHIISNIVFELNNTIINGRIYKIYQPENDELTLVIKNGKTNYKLFLSANASLPLIYLSSESKSNPLNAPNFCMLLRKHLSNGRIVSICQPDFERIIVLEIEHLNELGDLCRKKIIIEIMGKHSNIIFCDSSNCIIDSIKHISAQISSVREVLPGRDYSFPPNHKKKDPLTLTKGDLSTFLYTKQMPGAKAIYTSLNGISPVLAEELLQRSKIDSRVPLSDISSKNRDKLTEVIFEFIDSTKKNEYFPVIYYENGMPVEFASTKLTSYSHLESKEISSISQLLENYYKVKNITTNIRQKSSDLRKIVTTLIERTSKKYDLQLKQLKDTEKRDKYKIYGELINTYGYSLTPSDKQLSTLNYYTNENITIPIDNTLSPLENAQRYFEKYNKLKRTYEALCTLTIESKSELDHLLSIQTSLDIALSEDDLMEIKQELIEFGYLKAKFKNKSKQQKYKSRPFHYISKDGFHMYVGKNNYQNDELTFKFASGNDWWFHSKGMPGSHVIVKCEGKELPDDTFEEAGRLAAYYSSGRTAPKVEIDYTQKKQLKRTPGGKPGFVIYHTNYSLLIEPDISTIEEIKD